MMKKSFGLFMVGVLVLAGGLAVATHVDVPPISDGGELAYVRDYAPGALDAARDGDTVSAAYVAWEFDPRPNDDLVLSYTSRGRMADTQVWHQIWLPQGSLDAEPAFRSVGQWDRGMVVVDSGTSCLGLMNSVNAGIGYITSEDAELRFKATGHYDVTQVADDRVELLRDGHTYALETIGNASIEVTGVNVWVNLTAGSEVRTWIDGGAFPATTKVMHAEFDHLADDCLAAPEPAPEEEPAEHECPPAAEEPEAECPAPEQEPAEHECPPAVEEPEAECPAPGEEPEEEEPEEEEEHECPEDEEEKHEEHEEEECPC